MAQVSLKHRSLTDKILGCFYRTYSEVGFGFPESFYGNAFAIELGRCGLRVGREVPVEVRYLGLPIGRFRLDMVVEDTVLVEIKATKSITDADTHQILSYLKGTDLEIGLLLHFGPRAATKRFVYSNARKRPMMR